MKSDGHSVGKQIVWWLTWATLTIHLMALPLVLGIHLSNRSESEFGWRLIFVVLPLTIAIGMRWFLLPRVKSAIPGFFCVLVGLVLAETSGLTVLFLEVPYREALYCACVGGMLQFIPVFVLNRNRRGVQSER